MRPCGCTHSGGAHCRGFLHEAYRDRPRKVFLWNVTGGDLPTRVPGPDWDVFFTSTRELGMTAAHLTKPLGDEHKGDIARNPANGFLPDGVGIGPFARPAAGAIGAAKAAQFSHPAAHFDLLALSAIIPAQGDAEVVGMGRHSGGRVAEWSYRPFLAGTIDVRASYRHEDGKPDTQPVTSEVPVNPVQGRTSGKLVPSQGITETRQPTDYVVKFATNPTTEMTLAFPGSVDGSPGRLELAGGFDLFADGGGEIVAPMLLDASGSSQPLFIGVNLVEWLSFPAPATLFDEATDTFSITDGRSSLLPGFLLATVELPVNSTAISSSLHPIRSPD